MFVEMFVDLYWYDNPSFDIINGIRHRPLLPLARIYCILHNCYRCINACLVLAISKHNFLYFCLILFYDLFNFVVCRFFLPFSYYFMKTAFFPFNSCSNWPSRMLVFSTHTKLEQWSLVTSIISIILYSNSKCDWRMNNFKSIWCMFADVLFHQIAANLWRAPLIMMMMTHGSISDMQFLFLLWEMALISIMPSNHFAPNNPYPTHNDSGKWFSANVVEYLHHWSKTVSHCINEMLISFTAYMTLNSLFLYYKNQPNQMDARANSIPSNPISYTLNLRTFFGYSINGHQSIQSGMWKKGKSYQIKYNNSMIDSDGFHSAIWWTKDFDENLYDIFWSFLFGAKTTFSHLLSGGRNENRLTENFPSNIIIIRRESGKMSAPNIKHYEGRWPKIAEIVISKR